MLSVVVVLLDVGVGTMGDKVVVVVGCLTDLLTDYAVFFVFVSEVNVMALELLVMLLVVVVVVLLVMMVTFPLVLV